MTTEVKTTNSQLPTTKLTTNYEPRATNYLIMQNKPNFLNTQMNITFYLTKHYDNFHLLGCCKNKAKTNPIQTQSNPISNRLQGRSYGDFF